MKKFRVEVCSYLEVEAENENEAFKMVRHTVCDLHREAFVNKIKEISGNNDNERKESM